MKKVFVILLIGALFMHSLLFIQYNNDTLVVSSPLPKYFVHIDFNSTTPGWQNTHFNRIQDAIDKASSGERIIVYEGLYQENILIDKGISLFGEDMDRVIIDGGGEGAVVRITANGVDFSTFTIRNSGRNASDAGVKLTSSSGSCQIVENKITDCVYGLYVDRCHDTVFSQNHIFDTTNATFFISSNRNTIEYNYVYDNEQHGIFLNQSCEGNIIQKNTVYGNGLHGIYLNDKCKENSITENQVYENKNTGIRIEDNAQNTIISKNNVVRNLNYGIFVVGSNTEVSNNHVSFNKHHGIFLFADDSTTATNNNASHNELDGIRLQNSTSTTITKNMITSNNRHGIYLNYYCIQNTIFNNLFRSNRINAKDISPDNSQNKWYQDQTPLPNIINGPFIAGNFWDDYTGVDEERTGLGNIPYYILGGNKRDFFPLVYLKPIADAGGPYSGSVFESILFDASRSVDVNKSVNLSSFTWIFGDGVTKNGETVFHRFETPGNYTVELTVENIDGGTDTDMTYVIITPDQLPPTIGIHSHDLVVSHSTTLFTIQALVTDNVEVEQVNITYWTDNRSNKQTALMDEKNQNVYEKTILLSKAQENFYCVISAVDVSGNVADSKNPVAVFSCETLVNVSQSVSFDASESFDLDGDIISYQWDFGDGITRNGKKTSHTYTADGLYTVTLVITDDEGNTGEAQQTITVRAAVPLKASNETMLAINNKGILSQMLSHQFLAYDTTGDGVFDVFVDPNQKIYLVSMVTIDDEEAFLLSIDEVFVPEFLWMPRSGRIRWISHVIPGVSMNNVTIDYQSEEASLTITVDSSGWTWIDVVDNLYPNSAIKTIRDKTRNRYISDAFIWRKDNRIYVLDNPSTQYDIVFQDIFPMIKATFSPGDSGVIDEFQQTITISYNVPVSIVQALFDGVDVSGEIIQRDTRTFTYTPPGYWEDSTYAFTIVSQALHGSKDSSDTATYFYFQYAEPPQPSFIEQYGLMIILISIVFGGGLFYGVCKFKGFSFDSYVYLKNRKLFPFVKPVIFGPMSITVDRDQVSKAEFYVDGALKETISEEPFVWQWNERGFLNHIIKAKVFDSNGKSASSEEMSVFIINPFKWTSSPVDPVVEKE